MVSLKKARAAALTRSRRRCSLAFALLAASINRGVAGALLWPEGEGQAIVTTTFAGADMAFDPSGRLIKTPRYDKFEVRTYVEYGLEPESHGRRRGRRGGFRGAATPQAIGSRYEGLGVGALGLRAPLGRIGDWFFSAEGSLRTAEPEGAPYLDMKKECRAKSNSRPFARLRSSDTQVFWKASSVFAAGPAWRRDQAGFRLRRPRAPRCADPGAELLRHLAAHAARRGCARSEIPTQRRL